jgi:hypothetical protein
VDRVCTEQIAIEVHGCSRLRRLVGPAHQRVQLAHRMLLRLDREYRIFHREPNPLYPDGCIEYSLQRRWPCEAPRTSPATGIAKLHLQRKGSGHHAEGHTRTRFQ